MMNLNRIEQSVSKLRTTRLRTESRTADNIKMKRKLNKEGHY